MDKHIRDIINKCDDDAPMLDKVIKDIFMACDTENEGLVPVSKLVDFIMPFLQGNMHALEELQKSLDPNNINPSIDIHMFYKDMNAWTLKISSADHTEEDDILNITPRDFERISHKDCSFLQSTPRSSFGHHLLKGYVESGISNLSIASSTAEHSSLYFPDRTVLEEQIQELQHHKRQIVEELTRVKAELTSVTEHNETLQVDLDKVLKKLANEQKINAQLQTERKKEDDCEEELCCARKQVVKLERTIANLEKENAQLQQELDTIVMEKHGLEYQIQRMDRKSEETRSSMVMLQTEIDFRKLEVDSEQKTNEALAQQNQELCDIIEKCIINIDRLKVERTMLRKLCRERMDTNESLSRSLRSNSFSEYAGISRMLSQGRRMSDITAKYSPSSKSKPFNSPKLLRMLREPVTPSLDGSKQNKQIENTEESVCYRGELNLATMLLKKHSTPYVNKHDHRPLLDVTPPVELNKVPLLMPRFRHQPARDSIGAEMLETIFDRAMDIVFAENHMFNTPTSPTTESPPVMYVVERTPATATCDASSPTPYSPKMNDSTDEFFFHYNNYDMSNSERLNENLLDEITKATVCGIDEESECEESMIEGTDKCDGLQDENGKTYVTDVHLKLNEYIDLEQKCEALEQKIEELESENSLKDMKIYNLNNELENLRQKFIEDEKNKSEELQRRIDELKSERSLHQIEKENLIEEIKLLNEEKVVLELSKEELLLKVVELERQIGNERETSLPVEIASSKSSFLLENHNTEKGTLQKDKSASNISLEFAKNDFECLKLDYEKVKSAMETYQKLNENLTSKNSLLQKTIREKENLVEDIVNEVEQFRELTGSLKDEIHDLFMQNEDNKRSNNNLEAELNRKRYDLDRINHKLAQNEKTIQEINTALKNSEVEKEELEKALDEQRVLLVKKDETDIDLSTKLEEVRKKCEQEIKKQDYLCKKFVNLENELIEEKNSSKDLKDQCDNLLKDIFNFKETMIKLEDHMNVLNEQNNKLLAENSTLQEIYESKVKEAASLVDTKMFLAKRNEELLQENSEIFQKYDLLNKELNEKVAMLDEANEKLGEMHFFKDEVDRLSTENEEVLMKLRSIDSEDTESDQVEAHRKGMSHLQKSRERKASRKTNFDRLAVRNNKLEEKNSALSDQVVELRERLQKEVEAKNSMTTHTNTVKDILHERRLRLERATKSAVESWQDTLEKFTNTKLFKEDLEPESPVLVFTGPLDEEMWQLKHQMHLTTVLLSNLTCFINRQMLKKNESVQTDPENSIALHKVGEVSTTRMEETFATLVLTYTVDKDLLDQRFHGKKKELGELERSLGESVSSLAIYLEENAGGINVSNFMNNILQLCTNVSISAVQYGSLRQQIELTAAAEMMVNYVANLRQEIEMLSQQLPIIGPTTGLVEGMECQPEDKLLELEVYKGRPHRFLACSKRTCIILTFSMFVLVASLVLNTDLVFKVHRCPPPT